MPVRTRLIINSEPLVEARQFVRKFDSVVTGTAKETFDELEPMFREELTYTPGPSKNSTNSDQPYRWSNDPVADANARKFWFANFPNGRERTGELNEQWLVELAKVRAALELVVSNAAAHAKWVVDSFDRRRSYQNPGHARTGWRRVAETTSTFFDRFYGAFRTKFDESVPHAWGSTRSERRNR